MITSTHNRHVAYCRSLRRTAARREARAFLIEGLRLAREALDAGVQPDLVLYDPATLRSNHLGIQLLPRLQRLPQAHEASRAVLTAAGETRTSAGLVMVAPEPEPGSLDGLRGVAFLLVLDGISEPGNAGAILRSAAAAGLTHVVFAEDTVDPYAGKAVRAGMGAHFRLSITRASWPDLAPRLQAFAQVIGADAKGAISMYEIDWRRRTALFIGSEAQGLSAEARELLTHSVRVPMATGVESLNAAAVASILIFNARRGYLR